jgi:hypothetical protein
VFGHEHALLESRTRVENDDLQIKADSLALEEALDAAAKLGDGRARSLAGTRKFLLDYILQGSTLVRQDDSTDPRAGIRFLPHQAKLAKGGEQGRK